MNDFSLAVSGELSTVTVLMLHSREDLFQFLAPQNCSISSLFCLSVLSVQQEGCTFFQVHLLGDLSWLFPVVKARALWLC